MNDVQKLQQHYNELVYKAKQIRDKYEGQPGNLTGQEEIEFRNYMDEADKTANRIGDLKKFDALEKLANGAEPAGLPLYGHGTAPAANAAIASGSDEKKLRAAYTKFLKFGLMSLSPMEINAYQADNPAGGGFLVAPQDFQRDLIVLIKDKVWVRGMAKVTTIDRADTLGIPAIDTDPSDADWTSELQTAPEETTLAIGKRELRPHEVVKQIKISNKLLRLAGVDAEAEILDRLAYKFAITEEKAFLTGDGANKPLGVFTASTGGISTNRDQRAASATALVGDDFIGAKYALKPGYYDKAAWIINRSVVAAIRKLKDKNDNYLWTLGIPGYAGATGPGNGMQGTPDQLLGHPVYMSEYAPSSLTANGYVAVFGDFSRYQIVDSLDMQVQVVDQLYATTGQTGYIARKSTDGMPTLEEAFVRLQMAAS